MADKPLGALIVGILSIIFGVLTILGGLAAFLVGGLIGAFASSMPGAGPFMAGLGGAFGVILILFGAFDIFLGINILNLKNWARIVATVFAVLSLIGFPLGTVLGAVEIYLLWFHKETKDAFK